MKEAKHLCFRLYVYALFYQHTVRREKCSFKTVPSKVIGVTSVKTDMST